MDRQEIVTWVEGYIRAWNSNAPEDIGKLFAPEARYFTAPFREPWRGRESIVAGWLGRKDEPGSFAFEYEVLGLSGDTAFVRGWTRYLDPRQEYSNLWVIRLNEIGDCEEFVEWWMLHD